MPERRRTRQMSSTASRPTPVDMDARIQMVYDKQQVRGYSTNFKGKQDQILAQYKSFWQQKSAKPDVDAYLHNTLNHVYDKSDKWINASTPITHPKERILAEDAYCWILGNRASFDVAQYPSNPGPASMSFIHLLGVPKARLYNGVSLDRDSVKILDHMIEFFKASWQRNPEFRQKVLGHQRKEIKDLYGKIEAPKSAADKEGLRLALKHCGELSREADALGPDDFQFGLHLWPDHSISHLHMHIIAMTPEMRKYSTTEHDSKTKDALEVRDVIMSQSGPRL